MLIRLRLNHIIVLFIIIKLVNSVNIHQKEAEDSETSWQKRPCSTLLLGQFKCVTPVIDELKQTAQNCQPNSQVKVACYPVLNITCESKRFDGLTIGFYRYETCRYVTSYHYQTAVLLSVFLGIFGADRFYLGYIGVGVLKFCTCGFMLIGYLVDMLLIITQTLKPVDNSNYIVDYYGQVLHASNVYSNETFNFTHESY